MKIFLILISRLLFGFGLAMSGMLNPLKVRAFLDISGEWDPSLGFVMVGGILVTIAGYWFVFNREKPIYGIQFSLPEKKKLDMRLITGSAIFGVGWGIGGLCPGPSISILPIYFFPAIVFTLSMMLGLFIGLKLSNFRTSDELKDV